MTENLYALFRSRFPRRLDTPFIETGDGARYDYRDVDDASARVANLFLSLGLRAGDRVAVQVAKSPEALFLYLGCLRAGLVYLPLNTAYRERELDYFFGDAEPGVAVASASNLAGITELAEGRGIRHVYTLESDGSGSLSEELRDVSPRASIANTEANDIAAILYTSGTTGKPKGAMITHRNLAANALTLHKAWGWRSDDVLLHVLPIFHVHGLFVACHCVLLNGTGMLFLGRPDSDAIIDYLPRSTVMMGVPTHYTRLLENRRLNEDVCRNIRLFVSGSAPLLEQTFEAFRSRTGHTILERYGMTETGMNTSNPLKGPRIPGTVGPPLDGVSVRIVDDDGGTVGAGDVGMLQVKGDNVFRGYWGKPDKTAEEFTDDGFFITGDLARIDGDGYVSIVGRGKDLIISGGFNIYPKEIEACIDEMPGIKESAVVGVPHPDFGEAVMAAVVADSQAGDVDENDVIEHVKRSLANFKVPKRVAFVDALPRNAMGKVQKSLLRDTHRAEFG